MPKIGRQVKLTKKRKKAKTVQSLLGLPEAIGIAGTNHYYTVKIGK